MEGINRLKNKITTLTDEINTLEPNIVVLTEHKKRITDAWKSFKQEAEQLHLNTTTTEAAQAIETLTSQIDILVRNGLQHIDTLIAGEMERTLGDQLQSTSDKTLATIEEEDDNDKRPSTNGASPHSREAATEPILQTPQVKVEHNNNETVKVLSELLSQIPAQYNDILAGKFPKPRHNSLNKDDEDIQLQLPRDDPYCQLKDSIERAEEGAKESYEEKSTGTKKKTAKKVLTSDVDNETISNNKTPLFAVDQQPLIELKLDKIQLPTFDGDFTQWIAFRDQYLDLVHNNQRLTEVTKFFQLRSHLKGMALEAINGFKLCAADYEAAWFKLKKRYDKPEKIIDEYLQKFYDLPYMSHPTSSGLLTIVNRTNQLLRVLPVLGVQVKTWDTMLKYNIKSRLDRATYNKWLDLVKFRQNVPITELLDFLEIEAGEHVPRAMERVHRTNVTHKTFNKGNRKHPAAFMVTTKPNNNQKPEQSAQAYASQPSYSDNRCQQCKGQHELYRCPTFLALKVEDRIKKQRAFKVCSRCLRKHQHPADCKFGSCPVCKRDHNRLLCFLLHARKATEKSIPYCSE